MSGWAAAREVGRRTRTASFEQDSWATPVITLGIAGNFNTADRTVLPHLHPRFFHDSAAAIVVDGQIAAAIEEERVTRIKHTNFFPVGAISECLSTAGVRLRDVDRVGFFFSEEYCRQELSQQYINNSTLPLNSPRQLIESLLRQNIDHTFSSTRIEFVHHHTAHACAAYHGSGWKGESLVVILDGNGDAESASVFVGAEDYLRVLASHPIEKSLGHFYSLGTRFLGFGAFDEYKVMGLAPYGEPSTLESVFESICRLEDAGDYILDITTVEKAWLHAGLEPRRTTENIRRVHCDFAAALQQTLEKVALHILSHWQNETGLSRLCLAGGVAHNCSMNGRIVRSGIFDHIFVHPASHDAGAALGAALWLARKGVAAGSRLRSVSLGPFLPPDGEAERVVEQWHPFLRSEVSRDVCGDAADLLASGDVIGWVQGRPEFGPRALGHRSILVDPRPAENQKRLNEIIKRRESFRPFAPAVIEEVADTYFAMGGAIANPEFMSFVVPVRPEFRLTLGATTHVDGTARVQVVSREVDELFWTLIRNFGDRTAFPVILNTSLNNNAEPIVHSIRDAVQCFLTTSLDWLIIGNRLIRRGVPLQLDCLRPCLASHMRLVARGIPRDGRVDIEYLIVPAYPGGRERALSPNAYAVLCGGMPTEETGEIDSDGRRAVSDELFALWRERLIEMEPQDSPGGVHRP